MTRKLAVAALVALAAVAPATADAGGMPRAKLVRYADLVCSQANGELVQYTGSLPNVADPSKLTPAQAKQYGKFFVYEIGVVKRRIARAAKIATPDDASQRAAWNRWKELDRTVQLSQLQKAAKAANAGNAKGMVAAFSVIEGKGSEAKKLVKAIGFKVCRWDE